MQQASDFEHFSTIILYLSGYQTLLTVDEVFIMTFLWLNLLIWRIDWI